MMNIFKEIYFVPKKSHLLAYVLVEFEYTKTE